MPQIVHSTESTNLADLLERILDKGIVIAGDIRIKLVDVELLTINIRLLIASVEKAKELGIDWWARSSFLVASAPKQIGPGELEAIRERLDRLERA